MKTLGELISLQDMSFGKMSDLDIIYEWFIRNNKEQEGLELIPRLAKSQAQKIQNKYDYAKSWIPMLIDLNKIIKDKKVAEHLNRLQQYCCLDYPLENDEKELQWAKENIHNIMKVPNMFFRPTIEYLNKYGIEFLE